MKYQALCLSATLLVLSTACSDPGGDQAATGGTASSTGGNASTGGSSSTTGGSATDACTAPGDVTIPAAAANNYSFSSTLSFPPVLVAPNTELTFDWSAVTKDFIGHDLDPMADVDTVNLMLWKLTASELQTKLNDDELTSRELEIVATFYTENTRTSATLFEFTSQGLPLAPEEIQPYIDDQLYPPAMYMYTVMLATGEEVGRGTRMIQAFLLDPAVDNSAVAVLDTSTALAYSTDMQSLTPIQVPAGRAGITIDWSAATVNALGNEFDPEDITEVLVSNYSLTPAQMEADFLDLDLIAEDSYSAMVASGTSFSLSALMDEGGQPFPGIDTTRTWLVALFCGGCRNPAPWYLSILEPCAP